MIELVNRNNPTCNELEQHLYDPFFMRQAPSRLMEAKNISISGSIKYLRKQLFMYDPKRTMGECQLSWSPLCRLVLKPMGQEQEPDISMVWGLAVIMICSLTPDSCSEIKLSSASQVNLSFLERTQIMPLHLSADKGVLRRGRQAQTIS